MFRSEAFQTPRWVRGAAPDEPGAPDASLAGLDRTRQILLSDTLGDTLRDERIEVAHEIGTTSTATSGVAPTRSSTSMRRLSQTNFVDDRPPRLAQLRSSHPPVRERVLAALGQAAGPLGSCSVGDEQTTSGARSTGARADAGADRRQRSRAVGLATLVGAVGSVARMHGAELTPRGPVGGIPSANSQQYRRDLLLHWSTGSTGRSLGPP
jgi:hypothetical protein